MSEEVEKAISRMTAAMRRLPEAEAETVITALTLRAEAIADYIEITQKEAG